MVKTTRMILYHTVPVGFHVACESAVSHLFNDSSAKRMCFVLFQNCSSWRTITDRSQQPAFAEATTADVAANMVDVTV